ncbi:hypothetical protein TREVI0001_0506 [Treponema vincentii ATCC 35580]|uniref:Uncharacterized protein n=1 Tax=Treponema vincentii ATCC 35580 TaxID=596324 RepID=C8PM92_9SPIR|nr:hypothetical protein TREVI0001_0506 [Treponema vincentii ATCC 35580]
MVRDQEVGGSNPPCPIFSQINGVGSKRKHFKPSTQIAIPKRAEEVYKYF